MSTEEFRERIRAIIGAAPPIEKPLVRKPEHPGYYPPPRKVNKKRAK
jgi:hypothetical protein